MLLVGFPWVVTAVFSLRAGLEAPFPLLATAPFVLPLVLLCVSCKVFGLRFGGLGWVQRTEIPRERLRAHRWGRAVCLLCRDGIGIRYPLLGDVFVPFDMMTAVEQTNFCTDVSHTWPEVRSPMQLPHQLGELVRERFKSVPPGDDPLVWP